MGAQDDTGTAGENAKKKNRKNLSLTFDSQHDKLYNCISIVPEYACRFGLPYFTQDSCEKQARILKGRNEAGAIE